jgi:hypothetical protein
LKHVDKVVSDVQGSEIKIEGSRDAFLTLGEHDNVAAMSTFISSKYVDDDGVSVGKLLRAG